MRSRYVDLITIKTDASNDGDQEPNYSGTLATDLAAEIRAVSGGETVNGKQVEAHIRWVVEIRDRTDVTPTMRIDVTGGPYDGRTMNIDKVLPVRHRDRRPSLALHCDERDV